MTTAPPQETAAAVQTIKHKKDVAVAELNQETTAAPSSAGEDSSTLVDIQSVADLVSKGTQNLALGQYELASEVDFPLFQVLSLALEKQIAEIGNEMASECADTYFLYGRALLGSAIQKNSVLGEKAEDQIVKNAEKEVAAAEEAAAEEAAACKSCSIIF